MTERTELESCVLGVVWLKGPCTAYVVRQEFVRSQSSHWSGSGGAIYPLLRRLEASGLIKARTREWGTGGKKEFSITKKGVDVLKRWIGPPLPQWTAMPTFDPVRTRLSFLSLLPKGQQRKFVDEALKNLGEEMIKVREHYEGEEGMEKFVTLAALYELQARERWLNELKKAL